jgi:hypothetical protein
MNFTKEIKVYRLLSRNGLCGAGMMVAMYVDDLPSRFVLYVLVVLLLFGVCVFVESIGMTKTRGGERGDRTQKEMIQKMTQKKTTGSIWSVVHYHDVLYVGRVWWRHVCSTYYSVHYIHKK